MDFSNSPKMFMIHCEYNQLSELNVDNCAEIFRICCQNNYLPSLDVSDCVVMVQLMCGGNKLMSLDVSNCAELASLYIYYNNLPYEGLVDLLNSLPSRTGKEQGKWYAYITNAKYDYELSEGEIQSALRKNWKVSSGGVVYGGN